MSATRVADDAGAISSIGFVPGLARLRRYQRRDLPGDALAGITVAAYLIPAIALPWITPNWARR